MSRKASTENSTESEQASDSTQECPEQKSGAVKEERSEKKEGSIRIKTGSDLLDLVVGGGSGLGYPAGAICNIVGDSSSGKSFLCTEIIANAHHKYKKQLKFCYDDCESGFSFDTKEMYGFEIVPLDQEKRTKSSTVEQLYGNIRQFIESLKDEQFGIYVVDSLDGLTSREQQEMNDERFKKHKKGEEFDQGSYKMGKAKFLSQDFFPGISEIAKKKNCLILIVSQTRDNVGGGLYGPKKTRAGGEALQFYCHCVLWLTKKRTIDVKEREIGVVVQAETKKLKAPRPFRRCFIPILFSYGIDNVGSNIDYLFDLRDTMGDLRKCEKDGMIWDDSVGALRRDKLIKYIEDNDLQEELCKRVSIKWEQEEQEASESVVARKKRF